MNLKWSLKELYPSFDSKKFRRDFRRLKDNIDRLILWAKDNLKGKDNAIIKAEEFIKSLSDIYSILDLLSNFAELTLSVEAKNNQAVEIIESLEKYETELTIPYVQFQKWIASFEDLETIISSSELLSEHKYFITNLVEKSKYLLSRDEELLISKLENTGSKAWEKLYNLLTSTLMVEINLAGEDKELPLSIVRNLAYDSDAKIRKRAYQAELSAYEKIDDSIAATLNGIKGEVLTVSKIRGYKAPLEQTLINSQMSQETLDAMFKAIRKSLPIFHCYYRKKGELLGHKRGLPFYDLFAPIADLDMTFTYEEAQNFIINNFRNFSDELANYAQNAFENRWIDAKPRSGKRGGAFCSNIHPIRESRILANFTGSLSDVLTLAHELGHGYHGHCLKDESILNSDYPMPLAETASIFCETIVKDAALKTAKDQEALAILEASISDAGQVIVDIYSRFLFESEVFRARKDSSLSVDKLKELMLKAQRKAYGRGLDANYLHPYMWLCKPHYYSAELNFYNFPYAFGLLFAKGVYNKYLKSGKEFVAEYNKFLTATAQNDITTVADLIEIDVNSVSFWRSSLEFVERDIEKFLKL
ncbi:M3 family oligoendopeptidase [Orenia marismortui]|uniref:PepF/M3 family oligoendopeptidase n=1 Tax=Orenia marismortui TaxID=46469 RepID=A0A4R8GR83_9FIRM|nr:M3 family oligoendopeptidase [Orenia marismortui]TDX48365.1 pepF/M3 family oligoendopeptidase [Orenia marismortui]